MKHCFLLALFSLWLLNCAEEPQTFQTDNGQTLFSKLNSEQTNIHFNNKLEDTKDHNIMIYSNYYGGAGIGIGDFNNDGLADIYFAGNLVPDQLYINTGDLTFQDVTVQAGISNVGEWSSGVLVGDVNQDGLSDIYVTRELYDDKPDLRRNALYINQGVEKNADGISIPTFIESAELYNIDDNQRTRHATFIDYDKDGDLDLFLLNQPPNPGDYSKYYNTELLQDQYRPRLLENKGAPSADGSSGGFVDVSAKAGFTKTGFPNSVTASDLNGDGWTDLYVANDFWVGDWFYINNGDGTFTDKIDDLARHISFSSMGVDAADINNDGILDLAVVDMAAEDNYRSKANMSGMNPDAFWKVVDDGDHFQYMFNTLQLNTGGGQLSDIAQLGGVATTDWSWSILMADFDNDSWKDIFISNGLMRDIRNKDAAEELSDYLESNVFDYINNNPNPEDVGIWDIVDIDTALSLVPSEALQNYIYQNNGDLTFTKKIKDWGLTEKTFSNGASYADLDNDGDLDLVINNINEKASIYKNNASAKTGHHYIRLKLNPGSKNYTVHGTKCWIATKEGKQFFELTGARGMYSTSESIIHFGVGSENVIQSVKLQWPDGTETYLENVKANQVIELNYDQSQTASKVKEKPVNPIFTKANVDAKVDYVHIENEFDDYKTQVLLPHKMSTFGPMTAVGDVNGDSLEDVFIGGAIRQAGSILIQQSDGSFSTKAQAAFAEDKNQEDMGASLFDADGDGDLDLYVVSGGNEYTITSDRYLDRLYINDGQGNFQKENDRLPKFKISGSKVRPADFDKDGDIDLFVAGRHVVWSYPEPATSVLLINENGRFTIAENEMSADLQDLGLVNDVKWFDYNDDGWQDIVAVGEWMGLTILENDSGKSLTKVNLNNEDLTNGWWFSVETADIDNDGDEDIIAGNLGENYKYKATAAEPFEVYYDDFDNNRSKDIVLTYYNYGIQYPLRGRQCSSEQIPDLKEKMPTYDLFASSDVSKVYGEVALDNALHYKATTFASTYFENKGNGKFEAHKLPVMAQLSSVNDLIIEDFNQDNHKDILLAGNLYNAEVETTRNDAGFGLLLLGDGKGQFTEMTPQQSGFFVPYNVKSLSQVKSSLGDLIFVGTNNDHLQVYKMNAAL